EYAPLGGTGMKVSRLCLGCMMFGAWGNPDRDDCTRIIGRAVEAGINFLDTADVYSAGESEEIVGAAIRSLGIDRDDLVVATKFHAPMGEGPNDSGNHRKHIFRAVEDSLRRLGTDYIDLYQAHRMDPVTDVEETLGALNDLVRQGKVRYLGSSTFPVSAIVEAQWAARRRRLDRLVSEQPPYSILAREIEKEVLPIAVRYRMGVIVWSPLAGGWLSGNYRRGRDLPATGRAQRIPARFDPAIPGNQQKLDAVERLVPIADEAGLTLAQLGIAWTLVHPGVTSSIVGPRTMPQLEGLLGVTDIPLPTATLDAIDDVVPPGATLNTADLGYDNIHLRPANRRQEGV
ncbi:MAG: aldo/keto reductase, partial [Actinomycetota bacterium]